jgi:BASS family bile acid:Na+ symporter
MDATHISCRYYLPEFNATNMLEKVAVVVVLLALSGVAAFSPQRAAVSVSHRNIYALKQLQTPSQSLKVAPARKTGLYMTTSQWREQLTVLRKDKRQRFYRWCDKATNVFPLWTIAASIIGFKYPQSFLWFQPYITPALALTMVSMGMTLTVNDFKRVARSPGDVLIGFLAQFTIMPSAAYAISRVLKLSPELSTGLILVGCAPGGTASNFVTLIAGADVALSVLMTMCSTAAAIVLTPYLTSLLAGSFVEVKAKELILSTLGVVFAPVLGGLLLNTQAPMLCSTASKVTPAVSVLLIAAICGCVQAMNTAGTAATARLIAAISMLHSFGFLLGYLATRLTGLSEKKSRTVSIETGMQNSALAMVLSRHFPDPVTSALPGAYSAAIHSAIGSVLASWWRGHPPASEGSWKVGGIKDKDGDTAVAPPNPSLPPKPLIPDSLRGSDEGLM